VERVLYSFTGSTDGYAPNAGLILDQGGNLYGTTYLGGSGYPGDGVVFQLTPSGSGWIENTLHIFTGGADGYWPGANLVFDDAGNLYGTARYGGAYGGGTVFIVVPFTVLYNFPCNDCNAGPISLTIDAAGNLYGTTWAAGAYRYGSVFKLTRSSNGWIFADLYDFTNGSDGRSPGGVTLDANGNLWGTANGGASGYGVVFEITP
jgi:hypothetical protein